MTMMAMMVMMANWQSREPRATSSHSGTFILLQLTQPPIFLHTIIFTFKILGMQAAICGKIFCLWKHFPLGVITRLGVGDALPQTLFCYILLNYFWRYSTSWYSLCTVTCEVHFFEDVRKLASVALALVQTRKTTSELASHQTRLVARGCRRRN